MVISRKRFFVSVGILFAILISAIYFTGIIRINSFVCEFNDEKLCDFLLKLNNRKITNMTGSYTEYYEGRSVMTVNWILDQTSQALKYYQNGQEEMHLLIFDDYIYLKDYTDSRWWQQSKADAELFSTKLPFEPAVFFANLNISIQDPQISIILIGQDICKNENCLVYQLKSSDAEKITKLYILEEEGTLRQVEMIDGETRQIVTINKDSQKISKPDKDVKTAKAKDNIFLNNFLERSQIKDRKPKYLEEFEKIRLQAEENGEFSNAPKYIDPELTLTP